MCTWETSGRLLAGLLGLALATPAPAGAREEAPPPAAHEEESAAPDAEEPKAADNQTGDEPAAPIKPDTPEAGSKSTTTDASPAAKLPATGKSPPVATKPAAAPPKKSATIDSKTHQEDEEILRDLDFLFMLELLRDWDLLSDD